MDSSIKLPELPSSVNQVEVIVEGRPSYREAWRGYYTEHQMRAYAEQAVRDALAAVPVADERAAFARSITGRDDLEFYQVENVIDANLTRWKTWREARDYYQQARAALASAPPKENNHAEGADQEPT